MSRALASRWLPPLIALTALLAGWEAAAQWQLLADALKIEPFLVPAPSEVADALWADRDLLADNGWVTLQEVLAGFAISLVAGVTLAVGMHLSGLARRALYPLVVASQTIPIIVLAPILVVWFGFGIWPKLLIIALICFFPIAVNTLDGLRSVDPEQIKLMRTLHADRWAILRRLELPSALPYIFSGAKIAVAVAVIGAVFGEWSGASEGLGHLMRSSTAQLLTARTFAAMAVLSAFAILLFGLLTALEHRFAWWQRDRHPSVDVKR